jgi:hypothetical membrane protein
LPRIYPFIGIAGAVVAYGMIALAISVSPWFSWYNNALSDLGNTALHPSTALVFDSGLASAGVLMTFFGILLSKNNISWKFLVWSIPLTISSIDLTLIGIFNESFGAIHLVVSEIFFVSIALTLFLFSYVSFPIGMPRLGALSLIFGVLSSLVWIARFPWQGVAIQETVTSALAALFVIIIGCKLLSSKPVPNIKVPAGANAALKTAS